eukprot:TRINITY_DN18561_c0_g1_i1.p1 TRINITY_DN18561_c0_g1~~TRINITY_DN18561_c0_g1_i1.p1  ORF type:complete len:276 (+),score=55.56 TRINITY_DN18561_c0_g1_i1:93-920(+)
MEDRCRGALLGLAAGDRNGGPVRMAVRLAESLADKQAFDRDDVVGRYYNWFKGPPLDRERAFDTGPTFDGVFKLYEDGVPIEQASQRIYEKHNSGGVNAAHRSVPLAMAAFIADADLPAAVRNECHITHMHPLSYETALACVVICRALIRGQEWTSAVSACSASVQDERLRRSIARHALTDVNSIRSESLSRDGFSPDVLAAALYFVASSADFESAVSRSISFAGPANYCPVLVGAIAGARSGAGAIGADQLSHCAPSLLERTRAVANKLASAWT